MDARGSHETCRAEGDQKDRQQDYRERTHCARFSSLPKVKYGYRKQFRAVAVKENHRTEGAHESDEKNQRAEYAPIASPSSERVRGPSRGPRKSDRVSSGVRSWSW